MERSRRNTRNKLLEILLVPYGRDIYIPSYDLDGILLYETKKAFYVLNKKNGKVNLIPKGDYDIYIFHEEGYALANCEYFRGLYERRVKKKLKGKWRL